MFLWVLFFAITSAFVSTSDSLITPKQATECCEQYCYEEDIFRPQYNNLGSKSGYPFAKGNDFEIYQIPGCSPEKIWMLVRHGTRLPSPASMLQLKDLEKLRDDIVRNYDESISANNSTLPETGRLCDADLNLLKNWKWDTNITAEYDEYLTLSGWNEVKDLAKDFQKAFPDVFGNAYSPEKFRFSHTEFQRTEASYQAFVEGLFGDGSYNDFTIDLLPNPNMIMSSHSFCDAFNENLVAQDMDSPNSETTKFRGTEIFQKFRRDVSFRLGFSEPIYQPLSDTTILNMYEMCRFDKAWNINISSPWCSVFTQSQFKILEYHDDLDVYMTTSYGTNVTSKLFCSGMKEMLTHSATDVSPKVVAYFGHHFFLNIGLTTMGAFKDNIPLRSDNFEAMTNRKWRSGQIAPFTGNFAAVKYSCPNDVEENVKLKFFVNQKTLSLDWCDSNGICKLSDAMEQYSLFINEDCEQIFCSTGESSGVRFHSKLMWIWFIILAIVGMLWNAN